MIHVDAKAAHEIASDVQETIKVNRGPMEEESFLVIADRAP